MLAHLKRENIFIEWTLNNQIICWINTFFEWIFLPYDWMNKKKAIFIRNMNKKCVLRKKMVHFACFSLFSQAEIIFPRMNDLLNEYFQFNVELNIEFNHFLARFNVKINNQNVSMTPTTVGWGKTCCCIGRIPSQKWA